MTDLTSKNLAILELERAKQENVSRREIMSLASRAAVLETSVAERYLEQRRAQDAAISFLSAASCMKDARRIEETVRLLDRAEVYAATEQLKVIVGVERGSIEAAPRKPAEIFWSALTNI